jgi:acyl-CoA thioesterase FadM
MRPWLGDLGLSDHLNNGVYLSMMDVGRADLWFRSGFWARMRAAECYPVVAVATIAYRRSLRRGQRFQLETRALAVRDRALYLEQRFVVDGEIFARGHVKVRVLASAGGGVSAAQLTEFLGDDLTGLPLDDWMLRWVDDVTLPPTREPAPSDWD